MRTITIGLTEARTLLRAIEPHTLSLGGRRRHTSRLISALGQWWHSFSRLSLTPPATLLPAAIGAGIELRDELGAWLAAMRWHQATTAARQSWPAALNSPSAAIDGDSVLAMFNRPQEKAPPPCRNHKKLSRKRPAQPAGQRPLLLPIQGGTESAAAEPTQTPQPASRAA